jgi:cytoskeletal protein RodZ
MANNYNFTLSEVLKTARLERNLSFNQIELDTKIRASYIEALEKADYTQLPADIYVRSILSNYADYLNLEYTELLRLYRKEGSIQGINPSQKKNFLNVRSFMSSFVISNRFIFSIISVIIFISIFSYIYSYYKNLLKEPELIVSKPQNHIIIDYSPISIEGSSELNTELRINGQKISINDKNNFQELYHLKEGKNIIVIDSISNKNKKITTVKREVVFEPKEVEEKINIELEVIADTWIEVEVDGENIFAKSVQTGEKQVFKGKEEIKIRSQSGNETLIRYNNGQKEALGENDGFIERTFTND